MHCPTRIQSARAANVIHSLFLYRKQIHKEKLQPVCGFSLPKIEHTLPPLTQAFTLLIKLRHRFIKECAVSELMN